MTIKFVFIIGWFIAAFLIPIFQSYFAGELIKENGKINLEVLFKSKLFWFLMILWIVGSSYIFFWNLKDSDKDDLKADSSYNSNNIQNNGDNNTIINGDVYYILNGWKMNSDNEEVRIAKTQDSYLKYLKGVIDGEIAFYDYNDYDGNGDCEMFALVGEKDADWQNVSGELWYVDQTGAKKIEYDKKIYWSNPETYRIKGQCFLALEEFYETGSVTFLWGVREGIPYQPNLSGKGNGISVNEYDEIELVDSEYDAGKVADMMLGHTWKCYYFYYDGENFKEYGGI